MNSRDRLICAMNHQETDHVPLFLRLIDYGDLYDRRSNFSFGNLKRYDVRREYSYRNQIKRAEEILSLGLDDTLNIEPVLGCAEEYIVEGVQNLKTEISCFFLEDKNKEFLKKIYITPKGKLAVIAEKTEDWPHGNNIPVFSDFVVSRAKEFLIKTYKDLKSLKYILGKPKKEEFIKFKEEIVELKKAANRLGLLLEGGFTSLGDSLVWLLGLQNMILAVYDDPDFISELLDLLCDWEENRNEVIINAGIEVLVHSAWYEITDFWTPNHYREILKPRLSRLVKMAHQANIKFKCIATKSFNDLVDDYIDLKIDSIMGLDPIQGNADLKVVKEKVNNKISLWGGINSALTLGMGTKKEIEEATYNAIKDLAPGGGFVLYPVDCISASVNPWDNIEIMINKWKEIGSYPLSFF